ncbi:unnamed protein product [Vitrella brassicaformis CCMP3155]|uniref:Uncharacterized protein n=1 Tax=Vitrella brassicaformis (strain CCMP3155) TaxID=1169540 RepID=A0A0G4GZU5_VITBC|nr:unnamed protein product [Vitrella brassicaformis CCMP3155]|eukprot:CEM36804.1 unnamed protein product [Vitrella brassicaformis CCMP3155]
MPRCSLCALIYVTVSATIVLPVALIGYSRTLIPGHPLHPTATHLLSHPLLVHLLQAVDNRLPSWWRGLPQRASWPFFDAMVLGGVALGIYVVWMAIGAGVRAVRPQPKTYVLNRVVVPAGKKYSCKDYTHKEVMKLLGTPEYQEHLRKRGTDQRNFNWQARVHDIGGAYVERIS